MTNICENLDNNPWGYVVKNNILLFTKGPLSQWWGAFKGQNHPFTMSLDTLSSIYETFDDPFNWVSISQPFIEQYSKKYKNNEIVFNTAEQAMMFGKAILFDDFDTADKILKEKHPKIQKELGRSVKNFKEDMWNEVKLTWVSLVNKHKFSQHEDLMLFLKQTCKNYILAESAYWDKNWGIGLSYDDPKAWNVNTWEGENLLGKSLMRVRDYE